MSSVLFLDIVEYSKKSVAGQISLKERFNAYLATAIQDVPVIDRIILDTGDGAAVNFLGDVEDALKAALSLRTSLLAEDPDLEPELLVRIGINLGPVRLMRDLNGQPNIVGDGINVAQRVMGFAEPSQILVSRSYYDAVSRLSPEYADMFHYQGARTDKHVREHEVYAIGYPEDHTTKRLAAGAGGDQGAGADGDAQGLLARVKNADGKRQALYVALFILPLLLVTLIFLKKEGKNLQPEVQVEIMQPSSAVPAVPTIQKAEIVPAPKSAAGQSGKPNQTNKVTASETAQKSHPAATKSGATAKTPENKSSGVKASAADKDRKASTGPTNDAPAQVEADAHIQVSCVDGAQVFVDGLLKGTIANGSLTVAAKPGKHKLIVSHTSFGLYTDEVDLESGKTERVKPRVCK